MIGSISTSPEKDMRMLCFLLSLFFITEYFLSLYTDYIYGESILKYFSKNEDGYDSNKRETESRLSTFECQKTWANTNPMHLLTIQSIMVRKSYTLLWKKWSRMRRQVCALTPQRGGINKERIDDSFPPINAVSAL